jgi:putative oxidoreductase
MIHFLKNIMLTGGLLQIVYFGAGPISIDASRRDPRLAIGAHPAGEPT